MPVRGADLHFFEAVADIGITELTEPDRFRIVGFNGHQRDAAPTIIVRQLLDAALVKLRGGAVVASEDNGQHRCAEYSLKVWVLPSIPGSEKSGAAEPRARVGCWSSSSANIATAKRKTATRRNRISIRECYRSLWVRLLTRTLEDISWRTHSCVPRSHSCERLRDFLKNVFAGVRTRHAKCVRHEVSSRE